jgi:thiol-disulfide isomerase/thioredoxin
MGLSAFMLWPGLALAMTPPEGKAAPSMSTMVLDENDKDFRLESLQGRPVLVNFWATWCPPCVAELSSLDNAAKQLGDDVTLLLISVDRGGRQKALPFLQDRGITRPLMGFDPKAALSREMGVRGLPTSFLLNADQSQGWSYVGPREWDSTLMIAEIRNLLRLAKASPAPPRQNNQDHLLV